MRRNRRKRINRQRQEKSVLSEKKRLFSLQWSPRLLQLIYYM